MMQTSLNKIELRQLRQQLRQLQREQKKLARKLDIAAKKAGLVKAHRVNVGRGNKLAAAVLQGDLRKVQNHLQSGVNPNWRNSDGEPILLLAVNRSGNEEIVRALIAAGARVDERDRARNTALVTCVRDEDFAMVQLLVEHGAQPDVANKHGDTPLTNAACWGSKRVVEYLLKHGANPLVKDGEDLAPSDIARQQGYEEIADILDRFASKWQ